MSHPAKKLSAFAGSFALLLTASPYSYIHAPDYWTIRYCYYTRNTYATLYVGWERSGYYPVAYAYDGKERIRYVNFAWHPNGGRAAVTGTIYSNGLTRSKHNIGGAKPASNAAKSFITNTFVQMNGRTGKCESRPHWAHATVPSWAKK